MGPICLNPLFVSCVAETSGVFFVIIIIDLLALSPKLRVKSESDYSPADEHGTQKPLGGRRIHGSIFRLHFIEPVRLEYRTSSYGGSKIIKSLHDPLCCRCGVPVKAVGVFVRAKHLSLSMGEEGLEKGKDL